MEKEYKKVLEKYADADLYAMSEEEYAELKEAEMADMQSYVNAITDSNVPEVMYRIGRAVPDLKYLLESSADIWGSKVLYHQIMPGDKEFTEFTYNDVRRDVRGLGTSLMKLGLRGAHISTTISSRKSKSQERPDSEWSSEWAKKLTRMRRTDCIHGTFSELRVSRQLKPATGPSSMQE